MVKKPVSERTYVLILAGGEGVRFTPYSTSRKPKQFLPITHPKRTMIQETCERMLRLVPPERCLVSTNKEYIPLVKEQLRQIPSSNIIGEPFRKNTAPAIALAGAIVASRDRDAVLVAAPSDHLIEKTGEYGEYIDIMRRAIALADSEKSPLILGITPNHPSQEYGYIKRGKKRPDGAFEVDRFVEKPDRKSAVKYIREGCYFWNSGMFVWRTDVLMRLIKKHAPDIASCALKLKIEDGIVDQDSLCVFFNESPGISIDRALMEKIDRAIVLPLDVGWSDVGGWEIVAKLYASGKISPPKEVIDCLNEESNRAKERG
ncbi:MAG: mannose-1-phosphate guanylyltransferase [Pseudomonadota bacterium]